MSAGRSVAVKVLASVADVSAEQWDACANPDPGTFNPFISHAFLKALEDAGTVGRRAGWLPQHLAIEEPGVGLVACMPLYLKSHSQGEYIFDHAWAEAYLRAGGEYYPKLQAAVPFTPVPGRRLLVRPGPHQEQRRRMLAAGAVALAEKMGVSSVHVTFLTEVEWQELEPLSFLKRTDRQFHWRNEGYRTFDDFLGSLASRKRKGVRREREQALAAGLEVEWVTGREIREAHWDAFFRFYMETGSRKWGRPYLNRRFFSLLGETMAEHCLLVMVSRGGRYVAGALNLIGGDCLYGRYWGAVEHHPFLHFEVCYYQAIEFALARGLARVEAGAQGEHKLARGYLPVATYSSHWIADPGLRRAVARYLAEERREAAEEREILAAHGPYRRLPAEDKV